MSSKQKRAIAWIGTIGAVYLTVRYILPLVVPFLVAGILARILFPAVSWLHRKTRIPETAAAVLLLGAVFLGAAALAFFLGSRLLDQILQFADQIPAYLQWIQEKIETICLRTEELMQLEKGCISGQARTIAGQMGGRAKDALIGWILEHWIPCVKMLIEAGALIVIVFVAAIYWIRERKQIRSAKERSPFCREINLIAEHTGRAGWAYVKTEGTIMGITTVICMAGLSLMGNPYGILLGVLIGILDALPFFGTGTVFLPWIVVCLLSGNLSDAAWLGAMYAACYLLREVMESKWLGDRIGITALETMASMYVGLGLFGISGLFTGPVAWILIKEIDKNIFLQ